MMATFAAVATAPRAHATTLTFDYNGTTGIDGSAQPWTVPAGVTKATFDVYGAQGGYDGGGLGGRATATITLTPLETIQINVGGRGGDASFSTTPGAGGFNGGGAGGSSFISGAGGGGGSDVRRGGTSISNRVIVAGGGGGSTLWGGNQPGGGGGGLSGETGHDGFGGTTGGAGGGQTLATGSGTYFFGGVGTGLPAGSGGGGGYVGGAGGGDVRAGGGGSGFGPSGTAFETGVRGGHGLVTVTYVVADLAVTKTGPATVVPGDNATYAISVTNNGPEDAANPTLTDPLPAGTTFMSETHPAGWNCADPPVGTNGTMTCTAASLANGASAAFSLTLRVNASTSSGTAIPNTATVSSDAADPVSVNSASTVATAAACSHVITGSHPGSMTLSGGSWCVSHASIGGVLTIGSGTTAMIVATTVGGVLTATNPRSVSLCGSTLRGSVNISGAAGFVLVGDPRDDACVGNTLRGVVTIASGTGGTELAHNHAFSSVNVRKNSGVGPFPEDSWTELEANTVDSSLNCTGNTPAPTNDGQPNTVKGARTGQCGAAGF